MSDPSETVVMPRGRRGLRATPVTARLGLRLTKSDREEIQRIAVRFGVRPSVIVREAIRRFVDVVASTGELHISVKRDG